MEDLRDLRGKFITVDGEKLLAVSSEAPSEDFWIIASPWEHVKEPGAMQAKCKWCNSRVGLSPTSQQFVKEKPDRVIACVPCFEIARAFEEVFPGMFIEEASN